MSRFPAAMRQRAREMGELILYVRFMSFYTRTTNPDYHHIVNKQWKMTKETLSLLCSHAVLASQSCCVLCTQSPVNSGPDPPSPNPCLRSLLTESTVCWHTAIQRAEHSVQTDPGETSNLGAMPTGAQIQILPIMWPLTLTLFTVSV